MDDLISRSAAIEQIERREKLMTGDKRVGVEHIKIFLMNRPAVDAEPVRHGRWEQGMRCPYCGQIDLAKPNYCPNCGAKLDAEVQE